MPESTYYRGSYVLVLLLSLIPLRTHAELDTSLAGNETAALQIRMLVQSYPKHLIETEEPNTVQWKDGSVAVFDDARVKTDYDTLLDHASLADQMRMPYSLGWPVPVPAPYEDPGRVRNEAFFRTVYGDSEAAVRAQLDEVAWNVGGRRGVVRFSGNNGAAEALARVAADLDAASEAAQALVAQPNGTFVWRAIAGTNRLSMHSFGIAIDFQMPPRLQRYWKWEPGASQGNSTYPAEVLSDAALGEVVTIFEEHGFIWGGKWYHFDLFHFEYRPELIALARATE